MGKRSQNQDGGIAHGELIDAPIAKAESESKAIIRRLTSGTLIPISAALAAIKEEVNPQKLADLAKTLEAAKQLDNKNRERSRYWGKLAIYTGKQLGAAIKRGQEEGLIQLGGRPTKKPLDRLTVSEIVPNGNYAHRCYKLAEVDDDTIEEYCAACDAKDEDYTKAGVVRFASNPTLVGKMTGNEEAYTPEEYVEAARRVMGTIDLDPASCDMAQETVRAVNYFTAEDNGLIFDWFGNVWMNPPYTARVINEFVSKLCKQYAEGSIKQAVMLTNNNTDTSWFHEALNHAASFCLTKGRISFETPEGGITAPTNGQTFFYFGKNTKAFTDEFSRFGAIVGVIALTRELQ